MKVVRLAVQIVGAGPETIITRDGQTFRAKKLFILTNEGALVDNLTIKDVYANGATSAKVKNCAFSSSTAVF